MHKQNILLTVSRIKMGRCIKKRSIKYVSACVFVCTYPWQIFFEKPKLHLDNHFLQKIALKCHL